MAERSTASVSGRTRAWDELSVTGQDFNMENQPRPEGSYSLSVVEPLFIYRLISPI